MFSFRQCDVGMLRRRFTQGTTDFAGHQNEAAISRASQGFRTLCATLLPARKNSMDSLKSLH
jgi:hypothetical protein